MNTRFIKWLLRLAVMSIKGKQPKHEHARRLIATAIQRLDSTRPAAEEEVEFRCVKCNSIIAVYRT